MISQSDGIWPRIQILLTAVIIHQSWDRDLSDHLAFIPGSVG